jgi:hypothetical protein
MKLAKRQMLKILITKLEIKLNKQKEQIKIKFLILKSFQLLEA